MGTVYVVQTPKPGPQGFTYDISSCTSYGQPVFIFTERDQPGLTPGPSMFKAQKMLKDFSDEDYILWAGGDPAGLAIATMVAAQVNHGRLKFLRWERQRVEGVRDAKRGYYIPVEINVRGQL